jgi:hypothetical protein
MAVYECSPWDSRKKVSYEETDSEKIPRYHPKHVLQENGLWLDADYSSAFLNQKCLCNCTAKQHLDGNDICLSPGCWCDGFVEQGYTTIIPQKENKLPRKEEEWTTLPLVKAARHHEEVSEIIL